MEQNEIKHIAFSILHGTFNPQNHGGCSCDICDALRVEIDKQCKYEADKFYREHYPPPRWIIIKFVGSYLHKLHVNSIKIT